VSLDEETKREIAEVVRLAIAEQLNMPPLSQEEVSWVRLAIRSEVERSEFRKAIIEKTTLALVWAILAGVGTYMWHFIQTHITFK